MAASRGIPIVAFRIQDVEPTGRMEYYLKPMHWLDAVDPPLLARVGELTETVQLLLERSGWVAPAAQAPVVYEPVAPPAEAPRVTAKAEARATVDAKAKAPQVKVVAKSAKSRRRRLVLLASVVGAVAVAAIVAVAVVFGARGISKTPMEPPTTLSGTVVASTISPTTTPTTLPTAAWANLEPTGDVPPARATHAMAYDSDGGKVILFGGDNRRESLYRDTWAYDPAANTWTELDPAGKVPSAREASAMVYDSVNGKVILFGGEGSRDQLNDLWAYDPAANTWTELDPAGEVPSARARHALVYDSVTDKVILFGGEVGFLDAAHAFNDLWAYDPVANTWTELKPAGDVPPARALHALAYDSDSGKVILSGGRVLIGSGENQSFEDLWAYDPAANTWTELDPAGGDQPTGLCGHAMTYDDSQGKVILFGGPGWPDFTSHLWAYDPAANTWTDLKPAGNVPSARVWAALVYNPDSGAIILFGGLKEGSSGSDVLNDTWSYGGQQ